MAYAGDGGNGIWSIALQHYRTHHLATVGSTPTNNIGLKNAFTTANSLVDMSKGLAPRIALTAGAVTESTKLYTFTNVIAACFKPDGGAACTALFAGATTAQGLPTNTLDAALNIVQHPGSNVPTVFNAGSVLRPFQPALSKAPNDWTMSVTYEGCTSACGHLNFQGSLAIVSAANVLVANHSDLWPTLTCC